MRKLGGKNIRLFFLLTIIIILVVLTFGYFIHLSSEGFNQEYDIKKDSTILDDEYNYIGIETDAILKKAFDGNYYINVDGDGQTIKYKVGKTAFIYNEKDYRMYLYGSAYLVLEDGSIKKIENKEEINKSSTPLFYKIADRKYLFIDKELVSQDKSIQTKDYLLIELDKQGNASLANHEINIKTINPLVLKGSRYDFDVVHEKLIIGDLEIDLKNVIGSTNEYKDPEKEPAEDNEDQEDKDDNTNNINEYYNQYFKNVVESFNNLYNSVGNINNNNKNEDKKDEVYIDLTRWLAITSIQSSVTSLNLNYTVFDPNNEYSQVFITVNEANEEENPNKYSLSKEQNIHSVIGLKYDTEYTINLYYVLANVVDSSQSEVLSDSIKIKTKSPNMSMAITKVTVDKIYYKISMDENYKIENGTINFYSDSQKISSEIFDLNKVKNNEYIGYFTYTNLGQVVELTFENLIFNGTSLNLKYNSKYINR